MDAALMGKLSVSEAVYKDCFIVLLIKRRFYNMQFIACIKCSGNLSIYYCETEAFFLLTFLRFFEFFISIPLGRRAFRCYWVALQNFLAKTFCPSVRRFRIQSRELFMPCGAFIHTLTSYNFKNII